MSGVDHHVDVAGTRVALVLVALASVTMLGCPGAPSRPTNRSEPPPPIAQPTPPPLPPTADPAPSPAPQVATLVGAGDIGVCGQTAPEDTARLLDLIPGTIFTTGDNAYPSGTDQQFRDCYGPTWGRHRQRTRPSPGNHDYESPGAAPYFAYFGANAGPPGLGYYSYRLGDWDVFSLNSNIVSDERSAQYEWLRSELQRPVRCSLAYWHHPVVSEGPNGDARHMRAIWKLLFDSGVDVVITGHDHNYQRFIPLDGDLRRSPVVGMRQFVVGTGGASPYSFDGGSAATEVRGAAWGVLKLTLASDRYDWEFLAVPGQLFRDSGSAACR
jgi:hypothetical protein